MKGTGDKRRRGPCIGVGITLLLQLIGRGRRAARVDWGISVCACSNGNLDDGGVEHAPLQRHG
jgi:hypothetical protein